jgi:Putative regulator of cell autolysis
MIDLMGILRAFNKKFNQDTHMSQKFIGLVVCLVAIPLIFLTLVFFLQFQQIIGNEVGDSYEQVVSQYVNNIENKFTIYKNLIDTIAVNGVVQDIFAHQDEKKLKDTISIGRTFSKEIDNQIFAKNTKEIYNIMLYALNKEFPSDGIHTSNVSYVENEKWYQELTEKNQILHYFYYPIESLDVDIVSLVKPIPDLSGNKYTKKMGYVKIDLYAKYFFSMSNQTEIKNGYSIYILDQTGSKIYTNNMEAFPFQASEITNKTGGKDSGRITTSDSRIMIYHKIAGCDWMACIVFQNTELESRVREIGSNVLFMVLLLLVILIGLTILFSRVFTKRTYQLIDKINKIENGDLDVTDVIDGKDEIAVIDKHFNRMVLRLNELINQNYIQKIENRESELKALQLQINPHFLYNTLESISAMASVNGCREICAIADKLGMMFRYNINKERSEFVTLIEEIEHIRNYFYIQSVRFEHAFTSIIDIPEELKKCKIPRFILQPIVENSIQYGFGGRKGQGCIEISACIEEGCLCINIYDDGRGILEEQLESLIIYINEIDSKQINDSRESIGIKNVNTRIKLLYGDRYGVFIKSKLNQGTRVKIVLPLHDRIGGKSHV